MSPTSNQLKNPAGLQTTLRADGLPVNVSFSGAPLSASGQPEDNVSKSVLGAVVRLSSSGRSAHFVIRPVGSSQWHRRVHLRRPRSRAPNTLCSPPSAGWRQQASLWPAGLRPGVRQPAVHRVTKPPQPASRRLSLPAEGPRVTARPLLRWRPASHQD